MEVFISKIQYDFFEKGEFVEIQESNAEQILKKIDTFDWGRYRKNMYTLSLTCPSITIEHPDRSYLKIGLYYYGEYILYYLSPSKKLFHKVANTLEEVKQLLMSYLNGKFQLDIFIKYWEIEMCPERFFKTKKFYYRVNWERNLWMLLMPLILFVPFCFIAFRDVKMSYESVFIILFMTFFFVFFSGIPFYLFLDHYFFSRKLVLELSRGSDEFSFGEKDNLKRYNKADIARIIDWGYHTIGTRGPIWDNFHVYQLEMKNGETLKFTSLLISGLRFGYKLAEFQIKNIHRGIPSIKSTNNVV